MANLPFLFRHRDNYPPAYLADLNCVNICGTKMLVHYIRLRFFSGFDVSTDLKVKLELVPVVGIIEISD